MAARARWRRITEARRRRSAEYSITVDKGTGQVAEPMPHWGLCGIVRLQQLLLRDEAETKAHLKEWKPEQETVILRCFNSTRKTGTWWCTADVDISTVFYFMKLMFLKPWLPFPEATPRMLSGNNVLLCGCASAGYPSGGARLPVTLNLRLGVQRWTKGGFPGFQWAFQ